MIALRGQLQSGSTLLVVRSDSPGRSDSQIADDVARVLEWTAPLPGSISARVDNGCVTLEGTVSFRYQKKAAERAVARLTGIRAVESRVLVATSEAAEDVRKAIKSAICRRLDQPVIDIV